MIGMDHLKDIELLVCLVLHQRGPIGLKDLSKCIGALKDTFKVEKERASLDPVLGTIDGCVDDIPRAVRMLMSKGKVERVGATPKDWRYKVRDDLEICKEVPEGALEALSPFLEKDCP